MMKKRKFAFERATQPNLKAATCPDWVAKTTGALLNDDINAPSHYTIGGIEVVEYMQAKSTPEQFYGHCYLTVMGYLSRHQFKGEPVKDLKKAKWWLEKLIEEAEKKK